MVSRVWTERTLKMSNDDDQKATAPELAAEGAQDLPLTFCRVRDENCYTLMASEEEAQVHMRTMGTGNPSFFFGLLHQIANVGSKGRFPDERGIKFVLGLMKASKPRDEIDAMLLS